MLICVALSCSVGEATTGYDGLYKDGVIDQCQDIDKQSNEVGYYYTWSTPDYPGYYKVGFTGEVDIRNKRYNVETGYLKARCMMEQVHRVEKEAPLKKKEFESAPEKFKDWLEQNAVPSKWPIADCVKKAFVVHEVIKCEFPKDVFKMKKLKEDQTDLRKPYKKGQRRYHPYKTSEGTYAVGSEPYKKVGETCMDQCWSKIVKEDHSKLDFTEAPSSITFLPSEKLGLFGNVVYVRPSELKVPWLHSGHTEFFKFPSTVDPATALLEHFGKTCKYTCQAVSLSTLPPPI